MGWLDKVPGAGNLFISGLHALRRREAIKEAKITHVVSVLRWPIDEELVRNFKHLQIEVDDEDDENLLEFFPTTNGFIEEALDAGGSVIVHCAMGKSRSATVVVAYLMHKHHTSPAEALAQLRESRGVCEPNPGFMKQLELYHKMNMPENVDNDPMYQRWLYQRELQNSRRIRQAPDAARIRFEDEHTDSATPATPELKCKKCRRTLAISQYFVDHKPKQQPEKPQTTNPVPASACAHHFVEPLSWMRPELEKGQLEGRFECPKCQANVGKYAWQGMQCSCGDWVIPGISLAKGRVDESKVRGLAEEKI